MPQYNFSVYEHDVERSNANVVVIMTGIRDR